MPRSSRWIITAESPGASGHRFSDQKVGVFVAKYLPLRSVTMITLHSDLYQLQERRTSFAKTTANRATHVKASRAATTMNFGLWRSASTS